MLQAARRASSHQARQPLVAFVVAGACRPAPTLLGENDSQHATARFLETYEELVFWPHFARVHSAVFLMLDELTCGPNLCRLFQKRNRSVPCVQPSPGSCTAALQAAANSGMTKPTTCFRVLNKSKAWREAVPWWCSMRLARGTVLSHEQRTRKEFNRIVFSRVDLLFSTSMGSWRMYPNECVHLGHASPSVADGFQ
jgi:hypothetical protein